jgi:hypothetical protein
VANGCRSRRARANGKGWVTLEPSPATDAGAHCAHCLSHYREISASILGIEAGVWHTAPDPTGSRPSAGPFGKCGSSCNLGITPVASLGQLLTSHVIPSHQPSRVGRSSGRHPLSLASAARTPGWPSCLTGRTTLSAWHFGPYSGRHPLPHTHKPSLACHGLSRHNKHMDTVSEAENRCIPDRVAGWTRGASLTR